MYSKTSLRPWARVFHRVWGTAPIALETDGEAITAEQVQKTVLAKLRRGFAQIATVSDVISAMGGT